MTVIPAIQNAISKVVFTCRSRNTNAMTAYTPIVKGSLRIISYHSDHIQCVTLSRTSVLIASLQFGHTIRLGLLVTVQTHAHLVPKTATFRNVDCACFPINITGSVMRKVGRFERSSELAVLPSRPLSVSHFAFSSPPSFSRTFIMWFSVGEGAGGPSLTHATSRGLWMTWA